MDLVAPGIHVVPVRSPTLPPATHTNVYIAGDDRVSVFDPASPWEDEQDRLYDALRDRHVDRIVLTHHHVDHASGARALADRLRKDGRAAPIAAHAATFARVPGLEGHALQRLSESDVFEAGNRALTVLHTPGHAPGHLAFHDVDSGAVIVGDLVAGIGTIVLDPQDSDLGHYLDSLQRVAARNPTVLLPAHGPALRNPVATLTTYVSHRHLRTHQFREALDRMGRATPLDIARAVYVDLEPQWLPLAAAQVTTHLAWMVANGLARDAGDGLWRP